MEIRARYVVIGLFVVFVIATGALFVFWLWGVGGLNERSTYAVRFTGQVSGLSAGSEVLFNGITVGEVTGLGLDPQQPSDVVITIAVNKGTPIRSDTRAGLAFSGLTGAAKVALTGGAATASPLPAGSPATITADNATLKDLTQSARGTLNEIDRVITDNSDSLHGAIASIETFAGALAKNADKVDAIVNGLAQLTGGGAAANYALHDLPAPTVAKAAALPDGQLVVPRPTALVALSTQRILIADTNGDLPVFDSVRWADTLPILVQARAIQAFEDAGLVKVIPDSAGSGEFQLALDLRAFHVVRMPMAAAEVTIAAKLLDADGKVIDGKTFTDREAVARTDDPAIAVDALSGAFGKVMTGIVSWATPAMTTAEATAPRSAPGPSAPPLGLDLLPPLGAAPGAAPAPATAPR
jgi:phospholipid/cholesterol/gamma-HCH transport system substrate-binding protein